MGNINRTTQQDLDRKLIAAVQKYLSNQATIIVGGVSYTPATLVAAIGQDATIADAATNAKTALLAAAAAAREHRNVMKPLLVGLKAYVQNLFTDPTIVAEFGFSPRKATAPNAATKARAVDKRNATRAARHTMGKNQKKGIHGTAPATEPTPPSPVTPEPVTPAPVAPAPAPAPAASH